MSLQSHKIVSAKEMARIEALSLREGASDSSYMERAGKGIAKQVDQLILERDFDKKVAFFIGLGNNGGDGYVAALTLLMQGYEVHVYPLFAVDKCSPLNQKYHRLFIEKSALCSLKDLEKEDSCVYVDAIFGTGLSREVNPDLHFIFDFINSAAALIVSIDIPSGLDGNTGAIQGKVITADVTLYLGLPKVGFFLRQGMEVVGELIGIDFGLCAKYVEQAKTLGFFPTNIPSLLPKVKRCRHKYEAGYVLGIGGSKGMEGSCLLAGKASLRSGAGIVRLFCQEKMHVGCTELIVQEFSEKVIGSILEESVRAKAMFVGPGLGKKGQVQLALEKVVRETDLPLVVDADGLTLLASCLQMHKGPVVLTPHIGEARRLLNTKACNEELLNLCHEFASQRQLTLVLKGAPTYIFHHDLPMFVIAVAVPGLATAGAGDVFSGILAALLAQKVEPLDAAILGSFLHCQAGKLAAQEKSDYSVIASDIIEMLPKVFLSWVSKCR